MSSPQTPPSASPELQALQKAIEREVSVDQSAIKLITGISDQLGKLATKAGPSGSVSASDLQAFVQQLNDSADALSKAVSANTPAAAGGSPAAASGSTPSAPTPTPPPPPTPPPTQTPKQTSTPTPPTPPSTPPKPGGSSR